MKRVLLFTALMAMVVLSCTRPRGEAGACFNVSKTPVTLGDTIFLLNCSYNYDKFKWSIPAYGLYDSVNRHLKFPSTAAGNLDISLLVFDNDTTTVSTISKTIVIQ